MLQGAGGGDRLLHGLHDRGKSSARPNGGEARLIGLAGNRLAGGARLVDRVERDGEIRLAFLAAIEVWISACTRSPTSRMRGGSARTPPARHAPADIVLARLQG